jgi:hypothetical protein
LCFVPFSVSSFKYFDIFIVVSEMKQFDTMTSQTIHLIRQCHFLTKLQCPWNFEDKFQRILLWQQYQTKMFKVNQADLQIGGGGGRGFIINFQHPPFTKTGCHLLCDFINILDWEGGGRFLPQVVKQKIVLKQPSVIYDSPVFKGHTCLANRPALYSNGTLGSLPTIQLQFGYRAIVGVPTSFK